MYVVSNQQFSGKLSEKDIGSKTGKQENGTENNTIGSAEIKTGTDEMQSGISTQIRADDCRTGSSGRPGISGGRLGGASYACRLERAADTPRSAVSSQSRREAVDAPRCGVRTGSRFNRHSRRKPACPEAYGAGASYIRTEAFNPDAEKAGVHAAVLYVLLAFFAAGFVTGCSIWSTGDSRQQCEGIINGYLAFARGSGFGECFTAGFRQQLPVFLALAVSALFIAGYVSCPVLLFIRGMGSALLVCSLLSGDITAGTVCAAAYIAASNAVLIAEAVGASGMSLNITSRNIASRWFGYVLKLVIYALPLAACSAVHAGAVFLLNRTC